MEKKSIKVSIAMIHNLRKDKKWKAIYSKRSLIMPIVLHKLKRYLDLKKQVCSIPLQCIAFLNTLSRNGNVHRGMCCLYNHLILQLIITFPSKQCFTTRILERPCSKTFNKSLHNALTIVWHNEVLKRHFHAFKLICKRLN